MRLEVIKELTRIAYNKTAGKYHEHFRNEMEQKAYDRLILDRFSDMLGRQASICDAGCGPSGHISKYLLDKGHKPVGIDISPRCIEIASAYNPEINYKVMDMMHTGFRNGSFDGIISFYSILYTPKAYVDKIFMEYNRILKVGGKLLLVVKKGDREGIIEDEWYEGNKVYFTHFVESEIRDFMIRNHFNLDFMDTRKPYDFEYQVDRIYVMGTKISAKE
jgi:SAM-dependent methyltransferase